MVAQIGSLFRTVRRRYRPWQRWLPRPTRKGANNSAPCGKKERREILAVPPLRLRQHLLLDESHTHQQALCARRLAATAAFGRTQSMDGLDGAPGAAGDQFFCRRRPVDRAIRALWSVFVRSDELLAHLRNAGISIRPQLVSGPLTSSCQANICLAR